MVAEPAPNRTDRAAASTAARAVIVVFAANAVLYATFATRLPAIRDNASATTGQMGIALLGLAVGSIVAMNVGGRLVSRFGSRPVLVGSILAAAIAFPATGWVSDPVGLTVLAVGVGLGYGPWDVAMNVQAHRVEQVLERPLMPRFHGCWSLGGLAGAGAGALVAQAGVSVGWHLIGVTALSAGAGLWALRSFIPDRPSSGSSVPGEVVPQPDSTEQPAGGTGVGVDRRLILLGLLTLCATLVEGAAADWLALYLTDVRTAGPGTAATGYVVFSASMALARLTGGALIERRGRVFALRVAGVLAAVGIAGTVLLPGLAGALIGIALWGAGIALVFPSAMSAAADGSPRPAEAIARVATIGYAGFLAGPPAIGLVGGLVGLDWALLVCLPLAVGIVVLARAARARRTVVG